MTVSLVIVNHNTSLVLEKCVKSILSIEDSAGYEIIIADNASEDHSPQIAKQLSEQFGNVKYILLDPKVSFSEANNKAAEISSGEYLLIMNPDIIFIEPLLNKLCNDLENDIGAVCPKLIGTDGNFQYRYFQRYPSVTQFILFYSVAAKLFLNNKALVNKYLETRDIDLNSNALQFVPQIPCAFFLTRRTIFDDAGKMDGSFQLFFEDVDLSYRIARKHKLAVDTSVSVTHLGGESFKRSDDYWLYGRFILSMIVFSRKHYGSFKTGMLIFFSKWNSRIIILSENVKNFFGKRDDYRYRKHKYFLDELKKLQQTN